ncbi:MAG: (Fe-S)-binding protein [Anaerolineales bacterium]
MRVQLLATCIVDSLFPEIGEATVEVLARAGASPSFPSAQTCCGQPLLNAGYPAEARNLAEHTIEAFSDDAPVVVPSGSCTDMIRHRYPELFANDPKMLRRARELAERTYELSEFLIDQLMISDVESPSTMYIAYHPACHLLRGLGIDRQPIELLQAIPGSSVERLEPECCGFGGLFSVDHAPISKEMLARTIQKIEDSGAEVVVGCDASCLMQIEGGLRSAGSSLRCSHLSQVLAGQEPGLR